MNKYYKLAICGLLASIIYFVGHEALQLYVQFVAFALIVAACFVVWFLDRVNFAAFKKPRERLTLEQWLPKAIAAVKKNNPSDFRGGQKFEGELLQNVPAGVLKVYVPGIEHCEYAFGEIWKDAENPICSSLTTIENHKRTNFCSSKEEVARVYLGLPKGGFEVFKKEEKLIKEVTT